MINLADRLVGLYYESAISLLYVTIMITSLKNCRTSQIYKMTLDNFMGNSELVSSPGYQKGE